MSTLNHKLIVNFETTSNQSLILATVWVVTQIFPLTKRGPTLIGQYADTKTAHLEHNDLIEAILLLLSKTSTTRVLLESDNSFEGHKNDKYDPYAQLTDSEHFYRQSANKRKAIWFVDSLNSFGRLESDLLKVRSYYQRSGFFILLYTGREVNRLEIIQAIFQRLLDIYIVNVNILLASKRAVNVYTYFPFTKNKCLNVEPYFYGRFPQITKYKYNLETFFPRKLLNMWGCKINVTTWTEPPYIKLEYNKTTGEIISLDGIEGKLLKLLANHMNFSILIVDEPGRKGGNGIEPGSIKMLKDGLTNISLVGLIYDKTRQIAAQPAQSYLNAPLNLGIPLGKMMTPLERLIRPFSYIVWIWLSFSLLIGSIIILAVKTLCKRSTQELVFGQGTQLPFTNLWNVFYGGTIVGVLPRRSFARYLLGTWILHTLIIRSAYIAQLFLILQDSRARSELNTLAQALKQNFTFYSYPITVPVLLDATTEPIHIKNLSANDSFLLELFRRLGEDENANFAVATLGYAMRVYNEIPENRMRPVNILRETLLHAPLTLYMRKHSYLADGINGFLLNIVSTGIINRFEEEILPQRTYITKNSKAPESIPLSSLFGLFFIYFFLLILSTLVFLLELCSKRSTMLERLLEVLNI